MTALVTLGGGHIIISACRDVYITAPGQDVVRLTVTGMDGRTTYIWLNAEQAAQVAKALAAAG